MAIEKQSEQGINMLDLAFKIVQATLATLAVYRSAQSALKAWKSIFGMVRGDASASDDN